MGLKNHLREVFALLAAASSASFGVASAEPLSNRMWPASVAQDGSLSSFDQSQSRNHAPFTNENATIASTDSGAAFAPTANDHIAIAGSSSDTGSTPFTTAISYENSTGSYVAATDRAALSSSKIANLTSSWQSRDASWSEGSHNAFMEIAFQEARSGSCLMLGPDPAYVEEMLVDVESIGSEAGKTYQRRVALVVGNSAYKNGVDPLKNPSNDASSMARVLRAMGFTVHRGIDLDSSELEACIASFNKDLETTPADLALFFYAGHGVQLTSADDNEKRNYMLSVDAKVDASGRGRGFKQIDAVLSEMRAHSSQSVFFYDACRNDPLGDTKPATIDGVAIKRMALIGAAEVNVDTSDKEDSPGILIAYATSPNKTADDAWAPDSDHSPFTQALLNNITRPGASIDEVLGRTFNDVGELTEWKQTPWTSSSLTEEVRLNGEIAKLELENKSDAFAQQSAEYRQLGAKNDAIVSALKGLPKRLPKKASETTFANSTVELYKASSSREVHFRGHNLPITSAFYFSNGKRVLTTSQDGLAIIFDAETGEEIRRFDHGRHLARALVNKQGTRIITLDESSGPALVWDAQTGKNVFYLGTGRSYHGTVSFSRDGTLIVANNKYIRDEKAGIVVDLYLADSGENIQRFKTGYSRTRGLNVARLNNNANKLITNAFGSSYADIWDTNTGKKILTLLIKGVEKSSRESSIKILKISFSNNDRFVMVTSSDGVAHLFDSKSGDEIYSLQPSGGRLTSAQFSSDDRKIVTASSSGHVKVWKVSSGRPIGKELYWRDHETAFHSASFTANGRYIISFLDKPQKGGAVIWDAQSYSPVTRIEKTVYSESSFDPTNLTALAIKNQGDLNFVRTVNIGEPRPRSKLLRVFGNQVSSFDVYDDIVATASHTNDIVEFWNVHSGAKLLSLDKNQVEISAPFEGVVFSPDGNQVATTYRSRSDITIWNLHSGHPEVQLQKDGSYEFPEYTAFSPDGKRIYGVSSRGRVRVWNSKTGNLLHRIGDQHGNSEKIPIVSSDGQSVLMFSKESVNVINLFDNTLTNSISLRDNQLFGAYFTPKSNDIILDFYGTLEVYPQQSSQPKFTLRIEPIKTISGFRYRAGLAISPSADTIATLLSFAMSKYEYLHQFSIWDAESGEKKQSTNKIASAAQSQCTAFLPDEQRVVTGAGIWDSRTADLISNEYNDECIFGKAIVNKQHNYIFGFRPYANDKVYLYELDFYGEMLAERILAQLSSEVRLQIERERIRYWELEPEFLN